MENPVGTAPAFIVEHAEKTVITLPGVPREMEYLLVRRAVPYLRDRYELKGEIRLRVVKTVGLGESRIGELLADFMERGANPTVGTLAHLGQVDVRVAAKADDPDAAEALIAPVEAEVRVRLGDAVFGVDDATLEGDLAARLAAATSRLAVVEVGTAGAVASRLAPAVPDVLAACLVVPDAAAATSLGLEAGGAGAAERARALAASVARLAAASVGAATYVEPVSDSAPPVVRVALAVAVGGAAEAREHRFGGDAPSIRIRAATLLIDLARRALPPPAADGAGRGRVA